MNGEIGKSRGRPPRTLMPWQGGDLSRRHGGRLGIIVSKMRRFGKIMLLVGNGFETWKGRVPRITLYFVILRASYLNSNCNGLNCVTPEFTLEGG